MASPASSAEFLDLLRKSGVLDEKRLDAHLDKLRAANALPAEAGKLAGVLVRDGLLTHFQAEQLMLGKWRRFTIGKYKVLERLGSGGMGSVYLCEHKLMRRRVAVKVLPTAKASDPSALERFYREARAVAALDHENIVHAYDIDQDENLHFLVMEYVDGASLQEMVKKTGPMNPLRASHYLYQAAVGLHHAHGAGLVHRDIKPGNVLVDRSGTVKVLDMGLARFFNDEEDILTKKYDENVLGTADYLAPEQALDSHSVDIRADIYSLGATLYFVLTGRTPFSEGTVAQKLIWHQTRQPKPIRSLRPEVPEALVAIIEKMMAKDPGQRYQTPLAVAEAVAPLIQTPIGPPPEAEMPRLSLAATGVSPGESTMISSALPGGLSPTPRKNWQVPPSGGKPPSRPPDTRAQGTATAPPTIQPVRTPAPAATAAKPPSGAQPTVKPRPNNGRSLAPPPPPRLQPATDEDSIPWERLTSDTDNPTARMDTAPRSDRKNPPPSRTRVASKSGSHPRARERQRTWLVVGVVSAVIGAGLVALWLLSGGSHPRKSADGRTLRVNPAPEAGEYASITRALAKAHPGDRISVARGTYAEQIVLRKVREITIEAGEAGVVVIPPSTFRERDPLLKVEDVERVRVKGIRFDGQKRVQNLVVITGINPALLLHGLQLEGFKDSAVKLANCAGERKRPIRLEELVMEPADKETLKGAIKLSWHPNIIGPPENNYIHIARCSFKGKFKSPNPVNVEDRQHLGDDVLVDAQPLLATP